MTESRVDDRRGIQNLIDSLTEILNEGNNDNSFLSFIKEKAENEGTLGCLSEFTVEQLLETAKWLSTNFTQNRGGKIEQFLIEIQGLNPSSDYMSDDPFI